jgi:hypothetical protein
MCRPASSKGHLRVCKKGLLCDPLWVVDYHPKSLYYLLLYAFRAMSCCCCHGHTSFSILGIIHHKFSTTTAPKKRIFFVQPYLLLVFTPPLDITIFHIKIFISTKLRLTSIHNRPNMSIGGGGLGGGGYRFPPQKTSAPSYFFWGKLCIKNAKRMDPP